MEIGFLFFYLIGECPCVDIYVLFYYGGLFATSTVLGMLSCERNTDADGLYDKINVVGLADVQDPKIKF